MAARGPHNNAITWTPHVQLSWGGELGAGSGEIWTNGIRFATAGDVPPTPAELDAILPLLSGSVEAWVLANGQAPLATSMMTTSVHLSWVKANYILDTGLQRDSETHRRDVAVPPHGLNPPAPFFQTVALRFRTALKRGRGHAGRIYPPCVYASVDMNTGRIDLPTASGMAQAGANLINNINTQLSTVVVGTCVILSPANSTKGQAAIRQNITSVECDTVPDVQHRRTNRLARQIGTVFAVPPA